MKLKAVFILAVAGATLVTGQWDPNMAPGRQTIVHLFEWRWDTIAEECERFLGPYGYGGVQVSPITEHVIVNDPPRPWWERYQPVSYNSLITRSGTEQDFSAMVRRCNAAGVRIYVDVIPNHMSGAASAGYGTGGSFYNASLRDFPEYNATHFNAREKCSSASGDIEDWNDPEQNRNCALVSLVDLDQSVEYVRAHISSFYNKLIDMGVAGFRIDAAKHVWPEDLQEILSRLKNLPTEHGFPAHSRPFIYQEVTDQSDEGIQGDEYFHLGRVTEFQFGNLLGDTVRGNNQLKSLVNWGSPWGLYPDDKALVFVDNHDNQRGHHGGVVTFRMSREYKMAVAFMLAHPHGVTRVMSSYYWEEDFEDGRDQNDWVGPPNRDGEIVPPTINPDLSCGSGWICEHRWRQIYNMVAFRNVAHGTGVNDWWDNGNNQIAFCRGDKGFIAINNDNYPLRGTFQTCLPEGLYCDVISGGKVNGACTGETVAVRGDQTAVIFVTNETDDPILAIHAESRL